MTTPTPHPTEERLVLHYHGELDHDGVQAHLAACLSCAESYGSLAAVLDQVQPGPVPDRPADYESLIWSRLQPRLPHSPRRWHLTWPTLPQWAAVAAVAAALVVAFVAGRHWPSSKPSPHVAQVRERVLLVAVGDHLQRSQAVLAEILTDPDHAPVASVARRQADDLLDENRLYRQTAATTGDADLAAVLDDLERVLLQAARTPGGVSSAEWADLRRRVAASGLLLRVRHIGEQVREKAATPSKG